MLLTALALFFGWDSLLQQSVLEYFPTIQIEKNPFVEQELQKLRSPSPFTAKGGEAGKGANGQLPLLAPSPPIEGITDWINSEPLTIDQMKGKVVLIDFWTYSCINCIRTFPYLRKWYDKYKDKGLVIIGVHTPSLSLKKR